MKVAHGGNLFAICRERGWDWRDVLEASASINPLGPPEGAREAIINALDRIVCYPEQSPAQLAEKLAAEWRVHPEQILLGNGATEVLHFYARVRLQNRVALAVPTFSEFHRAWPKAELVPWNDPSNWPRDALLAYTQPNNPIGRIAPPVTSWPAGLLIDESFIEFTGAESAVERTAGDDGLLVLRSLTKFYALPGLRIGALVGSRKMISGLRAFREPWQVNVFAEAAALAAVEDRDHARRTVEFVTAERARMAERLADIRGLKAATSCANYVFAYMEHSAANLAEWLLDRKILIRVCTGTPGIRGEAVRFAIRTRPENERLLDALEEYFCGS